jgi:hypothetical protein
MLPLGGKPTKLTKGWYPVKLDPVTVPAGTHELLLTVGAHADYKPNLSMDGLVLVPEGQKMDIEAYRTRRGWPPLGFIPFFQ